MEIIARFGAEPLPPNDNTLLYAVSGTTHAAKARQTLTAPKCGFFASDFASWDESQQQILKNAEQLTPARIKAISEHFREAAAQAESNRLVKGRKSRTGSKPAYHRSIRTRQRMSLLKKSQPRPLVFQPEKYHREAHSASFGDVSKSRILNQKGRPSCVDKPLVKLQLQARKWSQQYRLQQIVETPPSKAPEANTGERFTEKLSGRAVKTIFESAAYVSACKGGFKTFVTLTFDNARRRRVLDGTEYTDDGLLYSPVSFKRNMAKVSFADGAYCPLYAKPQKPWEVQTAKTTIGAEVSDFINALKKLRLRGFSALVTERDSESGRLYSPLPQVKASVVPDNAEFHYLWVAECPANSEGEPNPHVHLLMDWDMPQALFHAWAARIERLWGNGFAKLERIRKPTAAGSYMIKAVGYAAKGSNANQGLIRGNRYNLAKASRAPAWEVLTTFEAGNMAGIITELSRKLDNWKKPLERHIRRCEKQREQSIKAAAIAKEQCDTLKVNKLLNRIHRLEQTIRDSKAKTKAYGIHASTTNRFSVTFEKNAERRINQFLKWAAGARGWSMTALYDDIDFDDIRQQARAHYQRDYDQFLEKQAYWEAIKNEPLWPETPHPKELEHLTAQAWHLYEKAAVFYH